MLARWQSAAALPASPNRPLVWALLCCAVVYNSWSRAWQLTFTSQVTCRSCERHPPHLAASPHTWRACRAQELRRHGRSLPQLLATWSSLVWATSALVALGAPLWSQRGREGHRRQGLRRLAGLVRRRFFKGAGFGDAQAETNQVVDVVNGIRRRRLGSTGMAVSELALGTQRWGGEDFNSPDEELCHALLDKGVGAGLNLVDTAEQYPIPSSREKPEGRTEEIIGNWLRKEPGRREKILIASKITGGANVTKRNILADCDASLRRLGTDRLDVYLLHWPARYTPQSNWGQSLEYNWDVGRKAVLQAASFGDIVEAMGELVAQGKIRGYGSCNDNAVGLMGMAAAARARGVVGPCCMQNDYSILNRRIEENGLSEASSPALENSGFMAYNVLAGGMLTGKYGLGFGEEGPPPPALDDPDEARGLLTNRTPRGRMDQSGWARTLIRYRTTAARKAAAQYAVLAKDYGLSSTALALRFAASRAAVTTSLVGHTSFAQLDESIEAFRFDGKAPLDPQLCWEIDRIHMQNRMPLWSSDRTEADRRNKGEIGERIP